MAVELQVLGYAALLQFAQFLLMAVPVNIQLGTRYTGGSRDEQRQPSGIPGRLKRAMDNHFEGLVLFTIAVLVVVLADASTPLTRGCAWTYLIARVLYVPAYVSNVYGLRSLIWSVGFFATFIMLVATLLIPQARASEHRSDAAAPEEHLSAALSVVGAFAGQLKTELSTAMSESGPVEAIAVCQQRAPQIARELSDATGFSLSRVSLKPRNPTLGPPTDWQATVLEAFADRAAQGEDPTALVWHERTAGEFRMMKAIPTGGLCLTCHGQQLAAPVRQALEARYPEDRATGYVAGEIRGAFVVTQTIGTDIE